MNASLPERSAPRTILRGGTIIDANGTRIGDVAIADGNIVAADQADDSFTTIDASGCLITTGLVDLHAHLGEPGYEAAETMVTGGRAAVQGGFTTVLAMPNTEPCVDTAAVAEHVQSLAERALCHVAVAGHVTVGGLGERLAPLGELAQAGVRFVTDCGAGIQDPALLRRALEYAQPFGLTIAQPAECAALSAGGQMHEGEWSSRLGLPGAPAEAEEINVMRDVSLARLTNARLHFQTLSTAGSFAIVNAARRSGVAVTAEIAAHHLMLNHADLATYDTNKKVTPPLRDVSDNRAAVTALAEHAIDAIVTDHTPHPTDVKEQPFDDAPSGTTGFETALAVALASGLPPDQVFRAMSWAPAELLGLGSPTERALSIGHRADVVVIDPNETFVVRASNQATAGTNCAFENYELKGRVRSTIVDGMVVVDGGAVIDGPHVLAGAAAVAP